MKRLPEVLFIIFCLSSGFPGIIYGQDLVLTGARIYTSPEAAPIDSGVVIINRGKIINVGKMSAVPLPKGMQVLDCRGMVLMAGFWNCHVHFIEPKWASADSLPAAQLNQQLNDMVNSRGFTHVFELATFNLQNTLALRKRISSGELNGPAILTTGLPFSPPDGSPYYILPMKLPEIGDPQKAKDYVNAEIAAGADGIKIWSASPNGHAVVPMPIAVAGATVATAHQHGKPVFAHPAGEIGIDVALASGVDILTHVAPDERKLWTAQVIKEMLSHHMAVIPTLKLFKWEIEKAGGKAKDNPLMTTAIQQAGAYSSAGGQLLFGTDVGYMSDYNTTDEFILLADAGITFGQLLAMLTTAPAKRFGLSASSGRIAPGMDADIVLLAADPRQDISHFADVMYTIRNGKIVYSRK